jgi:class 3 adenylate cyclase
LGDPVNVAARLATAASAGEILATVVAARDAGLSPDEVERREVVVKGKSEPLAIVTVAPAPEQLA